MKKQHICNSWIYRNLLMPVLFAASGVMTVIPAYADNVYMCMGPGGVPEYKNSGSVKGCKKLDIQASLTIAAPTNMGGGSGGMSFRGAGNGYVPPVIPAKSSSRFSSGGDFPTVSSGQQSARDSSRRNILANELQQEKSKLNELMSEFNNGQPERRGDERNYQKYLNRVSEMRDNIVRSQANITAIQKEMNGVR